MSEEIIVEETVPDYFIVYRPTDRKPASRVHRRVRPFATIERRCGKWLWWMRDESDIGLSSSYDAAKAAVLSRMERE